ncbi:hypothetical protein [Haliangium sp.]|uniref:hypothetical protein n=1 Tax=Haliangium sp. TaxID=2663208 RepID=UPI003D0EED8F
MRRTLVVTVAAALLLIPGPAGAQSGVDRATSMRLFKEGRALMEAGSTEEACDKFAASLDLYYGAGTQLNLARCYEELGRVASAWGHYNEAAQRAPRAGQRKVARARSQALAPRVPHLIVRATENDRIEGFSVSLDGDELAPALFETRMPIDPGTYELVATAPGHEPYSTLVTIAEEEEIVVGIGTLTPVSVPVESGDTPVDEAAGGTDSTGADGNPLGTGASSNHSDLTGLVATPAPTAAETRPGRTRRILAWSSGGVGVATVAGGLVLGWQAREEYDSAFDDGLCSRTTKTCSPEGSARTKSASDRATLSNIVVGAGAALVATGVVLYLTAPDAAPAEHGVQVVPVAGADQVGLAVTGRF